MKTIKYYLLVLSVSIKHFFERFSYRKGYKDGKKEAEQFWTERLEKEQERFKEEQELRFRAEEDAGLYKIRAEFAEQELKNIN